MEPLTFYQTIEKKECSACGCTMEEQSECYINVCNSCLPIIKSERA